MNTIICTSCGVTIEIGAAMQGEIEARIRAAEQQKHELEIEHVRKEAELQAKKAQEAIEQQLAAEKELIAKKLTAEQEMLRKETAQELELARKKLEAEIASAQKKSAAEHEMLLKSLQEDANSAKESEQKLREQLTELMAELREEKKVSANAQLEAQKKLASDEAKLREEIEKTAEEKFRLQIAEKEKKLADTQRLLDDAQRKAAQGSQQLQGEVMELDFERALAEAFRDDEIEPVAKGVKGGDIRQVVRSPRGMTCGVMLWEIKRTKNWTEGWIAKLKTDLRAEKANIPIIITEVMPKEIDEDMGHKDGVWICKPQMAIILGTLLRKGLLDAGRQKALADNRGGSAEALYNFVTSHEFIQQIEAMVETYKEMSLQIQKERIAYEKLWSQREKQATKLLMSTANIVGAMQGHIGAASMPRIKGLELDAGEEVPDEHADIVPEPPRNRIQRKDHDIDDQVGTPTLFG